MNFGEFATRLTIHAALTLYAISLIVRITKRDVDRPSALVRWSWTLGFVAFAAHMICAFHFYHDWSHAAAYDATGRDTEELFGVNWGGGLYFNYAFSVVWLADVLRLWMRRPQAAWARYALHLFMFFIAFNATVVFESGIVRRVGIALTSVLVALWVFPVSFANGRA